MEPNYPKNPYKILQVDPSAEIEVIRAAYLQLAKKYHPDKSADRLSEDRMKDVNWAYEILSDSEKRQAFDGFLHPEATLKNKKPREEVKTSKDKSSAYKKDASQSSSNHKENGKENYCEVCHNFAPLAHVNFHQNVSFVVFRREKVVEGYLCKDCIEEVFWEFTGKTLLFTWFGLFSLVVGPVYILSNICNYLSVLTLKRNSKRRSRKGFGWKLLFLILTTVVILFTLQLLGPQKNPYYSTPSNGVDSTSPKIVVAQIATKTISPTKKPTIKPTELLCNHWTQISIDDVNKDLCVYGVANNTYTSEGIYYITFGKDPGDFYLISYDGWFEGVEGNCVMIDGVIQKLGQAPVIVIGVNDELYHCKN